MAFLLEIRHEDYVPIHMPGPSPVGRATLQFSKLVQYWPAARGGGRPRHNTYIPVRSCDRRIQHSRRRDQYRCALIMITRRSSFLQTHRPQRGQVSQCSPTSWNYSGPGLLGPLGGPKTAKFRGRPARAPQLVPCESDERRSCGGHQPAAGQAPAAAETDSVSQFQKRCNGPPLIQ